MRFDYEAKYRAQYRENAEKVKRNPKIVKQKIDNFCELHKIDREELERQIKTNKIVAILFAKDPKKQNIYEDLAQGFIKQIPKVKKFKKLQSSGQGAKYISGGAVRTAKELKSSGGSSNAKSVDFEWEYQGKKFYATHKYTKEEGGAQGNQYNDIQDFIEEAVKNQSGDTYFIAIADGEFYQGKNGKAGTTRMENLKRKTGNNQRVLACTIDDLEQQMAEAIKKAP